MVNKYINATYQEIYDLATAPDKVTILGIRTPSGSVPSTMLAGLWKQFKAVKYNGADFVMRATARQPLDPLQIGTESGTQMDMRDVQNPILFRGCHGESLGSILNDLMNAGTSAHTFVGDSLDIDESNISNVENFYYQCLTDMSWKKSMPENGFAFNGLRPLVYNMASNWLISDGGTNNLTIESATYNQREGVLWDITKGDGQHISVPGFAFTKDGSVSGGRRIFSNELQPLGWIDTEQRLGSNPDEISPNSVIPRCYMGILMLPPAYTSGVRQFYRVVITHYFTFKDFRSISLDSDYSSTPGYYDTINVSKDADVRLTSAAVR